MAHPTDDPRRIYSTDTVSTLSYEDGAISEPSRHDQKADKRHQSPSGKRKPEKTGKEHASSSKSAKKRDPSVSPRQHSPPESGPPSSQPSGASQRSGGSALARRASYIPQSDDSLYYEAETEGSGDVSQVVSSGYYSSSKQEGEDMCECGPVLYSRILGHTADETILQGLQTVIDLCNNLTVCKGGDETDIPERDTSSARYHGPTSKESMVQTRGSVTSSRSQTDRKAMLSAGFQVSPNVKVEFVQTTVNPMITQKLQTAGLTETDSKLMQTNLLGKGEPEEKPNLTNNLAQTSDTLLPVKEVIKEVICAPPQSQLVISDEHKCICPVEPPASKCKCCKCSSSSSNSRCLSKLSQRSCIFGSKKAKCSCSSNKSGDRQCPLEVRYAITVISKYNEFTTFEVYKSTRNEPRHMPKGVEGCFVVRRHAEQGSSRHSIGHRSHHSHHGNHSHHSNSHHEHHNHHSPGSHSSHRSHDRSNTSYGSQSHGSHTGYHDHHSRHHKTRSYTGSHKSGSLVEIKSLESKKV